MPPQALQVGDPGNPTWLVSDPDRLENPVLSFFLDYWHTKRGDAVLPLGSSFVPREIRGNLQWVVVVDVLADGNFRYRLTGTRPIEYFMGDVTGKTIREAFAGVDHAFVASIEWLYQAVCTTLRPLRITGPSSRHPKVYFPSYDSLYLPYSSNGAHPDRVVTVLWFDRAHIAGRAVAWTLPRLSALT